jgi:hypothetical protein
MPAEKTGCGSDGMDRRPQGRKSAVRQPIVKRIRAHGHAPAGGGAFNAVAAAYIMGAVGRWGSPAAYARGRPMAEKSTAKPEQPAPHRLGRRAALARLGLGVAVAYSAPTVLHLDRSANAVVVPTPCPTGKGAPPPWCKK